MGVRVLLPVALAFSVAAGAVFAVGRMVRYDDGRLGSTLRVANDAGAIEGITWSSGVVSPSERQNQVLQRQTGLAVVLASILALTSLLTGLAYELIRGRARRDELAVHRAVGASMRSLTRRAASEASLVTAVGLAVGGAFGSAIGEVALSTWPGVALSGPDASLMLVPTAVLGAAFFTLFLGSWRATTVGAVTTGVVTRPPPPDPYSGIAIIQVAGSVMLLIMSAVLVGSGADGRGAGDSRGIGAEAGIVATVQGDTPLDTVRLLASIQAIPSVSSARVTTVGMTVGLGTTDIALTECGRCFIGTSPVQVKGEDAVHQAAAWIGPAAPFDIVVGRSFGPEDGPTDELVAVVSELFAQRNFERGEAIGRRVRPGAGLDGWHRVIGVSANGPARSGFGAAAQPRAAVYLSSVQHPGRSVEVWVDGAVAEASVLAAIREVAGDAEVVLRSLQAHVSGSVAPSVWFGRLFVALGAIALLCSLLGVRAVTRLSLRIRQTQFGIHRAVGANRLALARVALGQPIRASLIGAAVGLYGSLFFLDTIAAAAGSALPPVKVLVGVAVLHVGAALAGTIPMTVRFVRSSPRTLISGTR